MQVYAVFALPGVPMGQCGATHLVVEREAGDAAEQREVREVVGARRHRGVRVGLQGAPAVLAPEEASVRRQQLLRDLVRGFGGSAARGAICGDLCEGCGGPAADLRENPDVKEFYLGMSDEGRKSFRDVRSYRRRKRWLS